MAVTPQLIKELRERTGAGMMDCKKALEATEGNIEAAMDWLREKGISKAAKKADRIAAEGLAAVATEGNYAAVVEVNSETDFVAKNEQFVTLVNKICKAILGARPCCLEKALEVATPEGTINELLINATSTIGEKITLRRFEVVEKTDADAFGTYLHMGGKIGTITLVKNTSDTELARGIAMHVAASSPTYVSREEVSPEFIAHETHIQMEISKNDPKLAGKPEAALAKIVEGKVNKTLKEICLVDQPFVKDPSVTVGQYTKDNGCAVAKFVRFAVGEGMQKREDNFVEEVMSQLNK